jgi:hypothetical protein
MTTFVSKYLSQAATSANVRIEKVVYMFDQFLDNG